MLPKPSTKYMGHGPLSLARLTHEVEGVDDIEFLAIQDQVERLTWREQDLYREHYMRLLRSPSLRKKG
jgi:hypothetical protein